MTTAIAETVGHRNCSRMLPSVDFRQASSGPTPERNNRARPIGGIHTLKNGGPTVRRSPVSPSLSVGNIVASNTKNAQNRRIQLLTRKAASLDAHESSSFLARSNGSL